MTTKKPAGLFDLEGISCVSFNKDFTQVALSKKDSFVYIYQVIDFMNPDSWKLLHKLDAHVQYVSGIDWCHATNRLLTCSYDKTSYVWDFDGTKWIQSNVVVTTKLGFLCCKWNKRGDKFCEGTSAKNLIIGYFNTESKWWMGVGVKEVKSSDKNSSDKNSSDKIHKTNIHKSSVVCCEIDPNSLFVLSGSTDLRVIVSSCYLKEVDDAYLTEETKPMAQKFGEVIYSFKANCWINSVAWSNDGNYGFAAGQNAIVSVIDYKNNKHDEIKCTHSPVTIIIPNGPNGFFAVCYDRNIVEYEKTEEGWVLKRTVTTSGKDEGAVKGNVGGALKKFEAMGQQKKENLAVTTKQYAYLHKSNISSCNIKGKDMITTDVTGFIKYWKL